MNKQNPSVCDAVQGVGPSQGIVFAAECIDIQAFKEA